ncbi:MAG: RluA family pseudouridine synthase [Flavobacteriales bacterium]|nr:RluA family pseudouridine synthase [Flavobacteriales bacterium]
MVSPTRTNSTEHAPFPTVLYRDAGLLAVHKPNGVGSQHDRIGPGMLERMQAALPDRRVGLPHRLDRPVSGVLLFTLDAEHLAKMNAAFRGHRVHKTYWAIVEGAWAHHQVLENDLHHDRRVRKARVTTGNKACSEVYPLASGDRYTLVRVEARGGLFHQVRAQLAAAGHPIKGDVKYGARRGEKDRSIALHARCIAFDHPVSGEPVRIEAPAPEGPLWAVLLHTGASGA